eukprot:SAG11_NODE_1297_length_5269_cov_3.432302_8_plen_49_part_00
MAMKRGLVSALPHHDHDKTNLVDPMPLKSLKNLKNFQAALTADFLLIV